MPTTNRIGIGTLPQGVAIVAARASGIGKTSAPTLAGLEASVAITRLIRRFEHIELAGEPHWRDRVTIGGVVACP